MMMQQRGPRLRRDAPALRFLALCLGGWALLRVMMLWNPPIPPVPDAAKTPWSAPFPFAAPAPRDLAMRAAPDSRLALATSRIASAQSADGPLQAAHDPLTSRVPDPSSDGVFGADRHRLRFALMARLFPSSAAAAAMPSAGSPWIDAVSAAPIAPGQGQPFWMHRQLAGWSLGGWLYLRDGGNSAPVIGAGSQLGGAQGGVRLAYGFGDDGRVRAYSRATIAIEQPRQRELAFGVAFAPVRRLPVDIAVEQRVAVGSQGRTALAAFVAGGVGDVGLPGGFRLEAYAQAGIVGAKRRDGFADGAVVIDRRLGNNARAPFSIGAIAAGAVQPGAQRIDVGPRLTLRLPDVGEGSRIALDWRQRVAGDARPESGLALTLATDF